MKIGITNDHRGVKLKKYLFSYLKEKGYEVINYGTDTELSVDFPDYAYKLGKAIIAHEVDYGIAICGTGIGMSIALNKMKGIYCAKVSNEREAILCREHNDANVISMSEVLSEQEAANITDKFLTTDFLNEEKYKNRCEKIIRIENE